jgi:hypothetical protein
MPVRCIGKTKDNHQCIRNATDGVFCKSHLNQNKTIPVVPTLVVSPFYVPKLPTLYELIFESIENASFTGTKSVRILLFDNTKYEESKTRLLFHKLYVKTYKNSVFVYKPRFLTYEQKVAWRKKHYRMYLARLEFSRRVIERTQQHVEKTHAVAYGQGFLNGSAHGVCFGTKNGISIGFVLSCLVFAAAFAWVNGGAAKITCGAPFA